MPPAPSSRMMWYRGPNDWPTSSGPALLVRLARRAPGAADVAGAATVIASAGESDATVRASSSGTKRVTSSELSPAVTICVTSSAASCGPTKSLTLSVGTANRVTSSDEPAGDDGMGVGSGVSPRTVRASSARGQPHCGQRSTAGGTELPQDAQVVADCAPGQPPGL